MTPEQQAAIARAVQKMGTQAAPQAADPVVQMQMEAISRALGRPTGGRAFASPVIDSQFYQAGQGAEDLSTQPSLNDVDPFAMSEAGLNVGTPQSKEILERLVGRGMTFGLSQPAGSAMRALQTGTPFQEQFAKDAEQLRQYEQAVGPVQSTLTEIAGGVMSPAGLARLPQSLMRLGAGTRAAATGGLAGGVYGASTQEGGLAERGKRALEVAVPSALFGVGAEKIVVPVVNKTFGALLRQNSQAPTVENLKKARDLAYDEIDKVETIFGPDDYERFIANASKRIEGSNYVPEVDRQVAAAISTLQKKQGTALTLGEMDKIRQGLWSRHGSTQSGAEKEIIRDIIDELDASIDQKLGGSDALTAARLAHSQYKKAQLLDESFETAKLQAASTGSGGNVENLYRQAVTRILKNQKQRRFFSPQEIQTMESFVRGDMTQNVSRLIGKLSPSGNGLMMALNIGAVAANPAMVLATMAGASSKAFADARIQKEAQKIIDIMGGIQGVPAQRPLGVMAGPSAIVSEKITD